MGRLDNGVGIEQQTMLEQLCRAYCKAIEVPLSSAPRQRRICNYKEWTEASGEPPYGEMGFPDRATGRIAASTPDMYLVPHSWCQDIIHPWISSHPCNERS